MGTHTRVICACYLTLAWYLQTAGVFVCVCVRARMPATSQIPLEFDSQMVGSHSTPGTHLTPSGRRAIILKG